MNNILTFESVRRLGHKKTDSFTSLSSDSSCQFMCDADSEQSSPLNSIDRKASDLILC